MNIKKNKHKINFILTKFIQFILIIILLILTILSFLSEPIFISQRKLQSNELVQENNTTDNIIIDDKPKEIPDFGAGIVAGYFIFYLMVIYILVKLNKFPDYIRNRRYDLYTFIYFANNGTLIVLFFIFFLLNLHTNTLNRALKFYLFYPCSLILIIGGIYFIVNLVKRKSISEKFFIWEHLFSIAKLPCFVWNIIPLNDYCCKCNKPTIYYYADGHPESDSLCVCNYIWSLLIKLLKFIFYIYCIIPFYLFYTVFTIGWLIAKLIYLIVLILIKVLCFRKNENNISQNDASQAEDQNDTNRTESLNVTNQGEVQNDTNQTEVQNSINQIEGQNDVHQAEGQIIDNPITQSESIIVNINNNININQNSPNEKINKPNKKQMKNIDYLNDEEIHQKLNLSINRELNKSEKSQGNPTPNKVDNVNQNPINQLLANSD